MENSVFLKDDPPDRRRGVDMQGLEFTQVQQAGD
jgi:hypothetical protein